MKPLLPLQIGKHTVPYPIIQGGMAVRVSGANLVGAVANAGCIGTISTLGLGLTSPYFQSDTKHQKGRFFAANRLALIDELQKARAISSDGIIAVNVLVAMRDYADLARTAVEHGANMLIVGAGLPLDLPEYTANYPDVALVPIISGVPAARTICQQWEREYNRFPDAFIVGCPRTSGGHVGIKNFTAGDLACSLEWLIPDLAEYLQSEFGLSIPIIGSGGVWNRADIDTMLEFGASGVQIGTRFILTDECDADPRYKEFHLHASPEDVVIVPSPVGVPGRALRNDFTEKAIAQSCHPAQRCIANCLNVCEYRDRKETYCLIQALNRAARGDVETGLVFSGARTDVPERILPVADLVAELTSTTNLSSSIPVFS